MNPLQKLLIQKEAMIKVLIHRLPVAAIALLGSMATAYAQEATEVTAASSSEPSFWQSIMMLDIRLLVMLGIILTLMLAILVLMGMLVNMMNYLTNPPQEASATQLVESKPGFLAVLYEKLVTGKLYSSEKEQKDMIMDHEYDGIREMSYGMPPWLTTFFLVTIGFGVIYFINMYVLEIVPHQEDEYKAEMALAEEQAIERNKKLANSIDENTVKLTTSQEVLAEGKEIYTANCRACHGAEGQGGVGPNLTDRYWKHGGSIQDVFKIVKYGVPDKGMISWSNKLNPAKISAVSNYILTFQGTNPPNQKGPEGEEYIAADPGKVTASN
jgi:cytochrome c oxidase cbb3-type subunit 3